MGLSSRFGVGQGNPQPTTPEYADGRRDDLLDELDIFLRAA
jgi:hypothetical protein